MDDANYTAVITAAIGLVGTMFAGWMTYKIAQLAKVADATHVLVNSNFSIQLKLNAVATRRLADLTKDPADEEAAKAAKKLSDEHDAKQLAADQQSGK